MMMKTEKKKHQYSIIYDNENALPSCISRKQSITK